MVNGGRQIEKVERVVEEREREREVKEGRDKEG